jgi:hypothetical protein
VVNNLIDEQMSRQTKSARSVERVRQDKLASTSRSRITHKNYSVNIKGSQTSRMVSRSPDRPVQVVDRQIEEDLDEIHKKRISRNLIGRMEKNIYKALAEIGSDMNQQKRLHTINTGLTADQVRYSLAKKKSKSPYQAKLCHGRFEEGHEHDQECPSKSKSPSRFIAPTKNFMIHKDLSKSQRGLTSRMAENKRPVNEYTPWHATKSSVLIEHPTKVSVTRQESKREINQNANNLASHHPYRRNFVREISDRDDNSDGDTSNRSKSNKKEVSSPSRTQPKILSAFQLMLNAKAEANTRNEFGIDKNVIEEDSKVVRLPSLVSQYQRSNMASDLKNEVSQGFMPKRGIHEFSDKDSVEKSPHSRGISSDDNNNIQITVSPNERKLETLKNGNMISEKFDLHNENELHRGSNDLGSVSMDIVRMNAQVRGVKNKHTDEISQTRERLNSQDSIASAEQSQNDCPHPVHGRPFENSNPMNDLLKNKGKTFLSNNPSKEMTIETVNSTKKLKPENTTESRNIVKLPNGTYESSQSLVYGKRDFPSPDLAGSFREMSDGLRFSEVVSKANKRAEHGPTSRIGKIVHEKDRGLGASDNEHANDETKTGEPAIKRRPDKDGRTHGMFDLVSTSRKDQNIIFQAKNSDKEQAELDWRDRYDDSPENLNRTLKEEAHTKEIEDPHLISGKFGKIKVANSQPLKIQSSGRDLYGSKNQKELHQSGQSQLSGRHIPHKGTETEQRSDKRVDIISGQYKSKEEKTKAKVTDQSLKGSKILNESQTKEKEMKNKKASDHHKVVQSSGSNDDTRSPDHPRTLKLDKFDLKASPGNHDVHTGSSNLINNSSSRAMDLIKIKVHPPETNSIHESVFLSKLDSGALSKLGISQNQNSETSNIESKNPLLESEKSKNRDSKIISDQAADKFKRLISETPVLSKEGTRAEIAELEARVKADGLKRHSYEHQTKESSQERGSALGSSTPLGKLSRPSKDVIGLNPQHGLANAYSFSGDNQADMLAKIQKSNEEVSKSEFSREDHLSGLKKSGKWGNSQEGSDDHMLGRHDQSSYNNPNSNRDNSQTAQFIKEEMDLSARPSNDYKNVINPFPANDQAFPLHKNSFGNADSLQKKKDSQSRGSKTGQPSDAFSQSRVSQSNQLERENHPSFGKHDELSQEDRLFSDRQKKAEKRDSWNPKGEGEPHTVFDDRAVEMNEMKKLSKDKISKNDKLDDQGMKEGRKSEGLSMGEQKWEGLNFGKKNEDFDVGVDHEPHEKVNDFGDSGTSRTQTLGSQRHGVNSKPEQNIRTSKTDFSKNQKVEISGILPERVRENTKHEMEADQSMVKQQSLSRSNKISNSNPGDLKSFQNWMGDQTPTHKESSDETSKVRKSSPSLVKPRKTEDSIPIGVGRTNEDWMTMQTQEKTSQHYANLGKAISGKQEEFAEVTTGTVKSKLDRDSIDFKSKKALQSNMALTQTAMEKIDELVHAESNHFDQKFSNDHQVRQNSDGYFGFTNIQNDSEFVRNEKFKNDDNSRTPFKNNEFQMNNEWQLRQENEWGRGGETSGVRDPQFRKMKNSTMTNEDGIQGTRLETQTNSIHNYPPSVEIKSSLALDKLDKFIERGSKTPKDDFVIKEEATPHKRSTFVKDLADQRDSYEHDSRLFEDQSHRGVTKGQFSNNSGNFDNTMSNEYLLKNKGGMDGSNKHGIQETDVRRTNLGPSLDAVNITHRDPKVNLFGSGMIKESEIFRGQMQAMQNSLVEGDGRQGSNFDKNAMRNSMADQSQKKFSKVSEGEVLRNSLAKDSTYDQFKGRNSRNEVADVLPVPKKSARDQVHEPPAPVIDIKSVDGKRRSSNQQIPDNRPTSDSQTEPRKSQNVQIGPPSSRSSELKFGKDPENVAQSLHRESMNPAKINLMNSGMHKDEALNQSYLESIKNSVDQHKFEKPVANRKEKEKDLDIKGTLLHNSQADRNLISHNEKESGKDALSIHNIKIDGHKDARMVDSGMTEHKLDGRKVGTMVNSIVGEGQPDPGHLNYSQSSFFDQLNSHATKNTEGKAVSRLDHLISSKLVIDSKVKPDTNTKSKPEFDQSVHLQNSGMQNDDPYTRLSFRAQLNSLQRELNTVTPESHLPAKRLPTDEFREPSFAKKNNVLDHSSDRRRSLDMLEDVEPLDRNHRMVNSQVDEERDDDLRLSTKLTSLVFEKEENHIMTTEAVGRKEGRFGKLTDSESYNTRTDPLQFYKHGSKNEQQLMADLRSEPGNPKNIPFGRNSRALEEGPSLGLLTNSTPKSPSGRNLKERGSEISSQVDYPPLRTGVARTGPLPQKNPPPSSNIKKNSLFYD